MRDAPTFEDGQRRQQALLAQYQETFPEACRCRADDAEASRNHLKGARDTPSPVCVHVEPGRARF